MKVRQATNEMTQKGNKWSDHSKTMFLISNSREIKSCTTHFLSLTYSKSYNFIEESGQMCFCKANSNQKYNKMIKREIKYGAFNS